MTVEVTSAADAASIMSDSSCDLQFNSRWPLPTRFGMLLAAGLMVGVPLVYLSFLLVTGASLAWGAHRAFETCLVDPEWSVKDVATCGVTVACGAAWLLFFRPFCVRGRRRTATLEMKRAEQGELFRMVEMAAMYASAPMPTEVHVDAGGSVRLESIGWIGGVFGGRHRLVLGLSWVAMSQEGRLVADVTAALSQSPKGLAGRAYWLVRGLSDWLELAATPVAKLEAAKVADRWMPDRPKKKRWWHHRGLQACGRGFLWLTQRPLWMLAAFSKMVSAPALRAVVYAGDRVQVKLIGSEAFPELLLARRRIAAALETVAGRVQEGVKTERLPDNLPHLVAREGEGMGVVAAGQLPSLPGDYAMPSAAAREARVAKLNAPASIVMGTAGSSVIQRFHELSRQLTQMFYQQDLALNLSQIRLVSAGEARQKKEAADSAGLAIRTYFGGLAHPHRSLCGLVPCENKVPTIAALKEQLEGADEWMSRYGDRVRSVQKEWSMAWQRCRDLEMAHGFALAGLPLDARDYGLTAHRPEVYREEIERQEMIMMHSDEALRSVEANLERRYAAALGLVFCVEPTMLPEEVASRAERLVAYGAAYEALAQRLPLVWPLLNLVHAFDAMGVGEEECLGDEGDEESERGRSAALGYLVPRIVDQAHRLIRGLSEVRSPLDENRTLEAWMHSRVVVADSPGNPLVQARQAIQIVETYLDAYEEVFGWLSQTAALVETQLLPLVQLSGMPSDRPPSCGTLSWQPAAACVAAVPTPGSSALTGVAEMPLPGISTVMPLAGLQDRGLAVHAIDGEAGQPAAELGAQTGMSAWEEAIASHRKVAR